MVYYSWRLYMWRAVKPWMERELGTFISGVQAPTPTPERAGVSVTGVLLRLARGPAFRFMVSVPLTKEACFCQADQRSRWETCDTSSEQEACLL